LKDVEECNAAICKGGEAGAWSSGRGRDAKLREERERYGAVLTVEEEVEGLVPV
jgi:hypothetical protein